MAYVFIMDPKSGIAPKLLLMFDCGDAAAAETAKRELDLRFYVRGQTPEEDLLQQQRQRQEEEQRRRRLQQQRIQM